MAILEATDIIKQYKRAGHTVTALNRASIRVEEGEFVAITGVSGSGKSTFINICAGLDFPNAGSVMLGGRMITSLFGDELTKYRGKTVGFVFQSHKLIPHLTAYENILLPLNAANRKLENHEERFKLLVDSLGIRDRLGHLPSELSGGQAQRVAIARALIHYPRILFADEPTGNLDRKNADEVISLMLELRDSLKQTMVVVTHDQKTADRADRVYNMEDGMLIEQKRR
ncbi:MAG: ABC transporter ATP-binding protein [Clostridia bacterium]|nr:ABC transporter ATP-binding protein [Clostridia bacterium]MBR4013449.1 ABC transporter ATP-binding protein [Clostridia bacterium]